MGLLGALAVAVTAGLAAPRPASPRSASPAPASPSPTTEPPASPTAPPPASPAGSPSPDASPLPDATPFPGPSPTSPAPEPGGTLRYALTEPASIDPALADDDAGLTVVDALFDSLTARGPEGDVVPAAAEGWEASGDATVFTFRLRRGATFHDGRPVTAEDFHRAFTRVVAGTAESSPSSPHLLEPVAGFEEARRTGAPLAGVRAVDETTLRIRLREPLASLPAVLAHPQLGPVPPAAAEDPGAFAHSPVGNGPFRMEAAWDHGATIALAGTEPEGGAGPLLDGVDFAVYAGPEAHTRAFEDFRAGELDVSPVPPDRLEEAAAEFGRPADGRTGAGLLTRPAPSLTFLGFGTERPPFDDPAVRRAFSLLVDRRAVAALDDSLGRPADSLVPPGIPGHAGGTCDYCAFDPEGARTLLAGKEVGPVRLLVTEDPRARATARRIARDVRAATGIEVQVASAPVPEFLEAVRGCDTGVFRFTWEMEHPTPDDLVFRLFASSRIGEANVGRYRSAYTDSLLTRARRTTEAADRRDLYRRAEARILDDAAVAPIAYGRHSLVVAPAVQGFLLSPAGGADLSRVWLGEAS